MRVELSKNIPSYFCILSIWLNEVGNSIKKPASLIFCMLEMNVKNTRKNSNLKCNVTFKKLFYKLCFFFDLGI